MRKVFLENLPKHKGKFNKIDWKKSVGYKVKFIYDDIEGEIEILDFDSKNRKLLLNYNNGLYEIKNEHFQQCKIGNKLLNKRIREFRFNINSIIKDDKRDFIIIDKEYKKINNVQRKWYKYHCNKCGNEDWIMEGKIINGVGCNLCANNKAVLGINTIYDTDKWMIDLGVSIEDAKKYQHSSGKKITVTCPDCKKQKKITPYTIYKNKTIFCSCGDGKSYPEKFVINVLDQLNIDYEIEYSPNWIKPKRYDFYIPSLNTIIETHGEQHYNGSFSAIGGRSLKEEQQNDGHKRELALQNGIEYYIELDCRESNIDYIKNSIINSKLNKLFDLSKIDWNKCAEFANKNIVKEVCDYWNNKKKDETSTDLGKIFKVNRGVIIKYLKRGNKLDWCKYNAEEESRKGSQKSGKLNGKRVEVFKDNISLGIFESCAELERQSERLFGVKLNKTNISKVCRHEKDKYKNFTFKYIG